MVYPLAAFLRGVERPFLFLGGGFPFQCGRLVSGRPRSRNPVVSGSSPSLTIEKRLDFLRVRELT